MTTPRPSPSPSHSPLPWNHKIDEEGDHRIIDANDSDIMKWALQKEDADFICQAVNSFAAHRDLIEEYTEAMSLALDNLSLWDHDECDVKRCWVEIGKKAVETSRALLGGSK